MPDFAFELPSFAKINWFLKVGGKREDGYHEICTAYQTISLKDRMCFGRSDRLHLTSDDTDLPNGEDNLVIRSGKALQEAFGVESGARIHVDKHIPYPGGLGGGSSNAAVTMLGLCQLWELNVSAQELMEIAASLGADVPFFLKGGTVFGSGRGTALEAFDEVTEKHLLLAAPRVDIPTSDAFNALGRERLTKEGADSILIVCRKLAETLISRRQGLVNDFEERAFEIDPVFTILRDMMLQKGALQVLLSGSGPGIFGVFENGSDRREAKDSIRELDDLRVFDVETVSRNDLRQSFAGPAKYVAGLFT